MTAPARRACLLDRFRAKTWAEVAEDGVVAHDKYRGWHVLYSRVEWPGAPKPRRVRINRCPLMGRLQSEEEAERARVTINQRAMSAPLHEVLSDYMAREVPENLVLHRWQVEYLEAKRVAARAGELTWKRVRELETMPGRGYFDFWATTAVGAVDEPALHRWHDDLRARFPQLAPKTVKHIFNEFRGFLRFEKRIGAIQEVPEFPSVRVPQRPMSVPDRDSLAKILGAIPVELRGLFLARGVAGLRPAEARQLEVRDYASGALSLRPEITKTRRGRVLLIATVCPALDDWIREHRRTAFGSAPLFPNPRGLSPWWTASSERRVWLKACDDAGVERVKPNHGGRHAFATHEIADGSDPYAVMDWLGHASINTTRGYEHADPISLARRLRGTPKPSQAQDGDKEGAENASDNKRLRNRSE